MNTSKYLFFLLSGIFIFSQCFPAQEEILTDVNFDLSKPEFQRFYDLQDQQKVDSLVFYFSDKDPTYRYASAMALASVKDSSVIDTLAQLLNDDIDEVRTAAAYALGQIGSQQAEPFLIQSFKTMDTLGIHNQFNGVVLEAIGKCGSKESLYNMSTTSTYVKMDTALVEGQAWGIYRFALRKIILPEGTKKMVDFLTDGIYPKSVRFIAANYLARAQDIQIDSFVNSLVRELFVENDIRVRMALALALGKSKSPKALDALIELYAKESDYRVKCNIIRTLGNYEYLEALPVITKALKDPNIHVSIAAANFLVNHGIPQAAAQYRRMARADSVMHWQVRIKLYKAANRHLNLYSFNTRNAIQYELKDMFVYSTNDYEKAEVLNALGEFGRNYRDIYSLAFDSPKQILRTTCLEALANIWKNPQFDQVQGFNRQRAKEEMAGYFKEAIEKGDAPMIGIAADAIRTPSIDFKSIIDTLGFLEAAKQRLELPKNTEQLFSLQKTIDFFNGKKDTPIIKPEFNHPIVWRVFNTIDEDTKAEIITDKGSFVIRFFPDAAPGTVTNFVSLAKSGFFDGKTFHRVISNFVIQGGCPRGDGYGSLEYTIRSELPPMNYNKKGYVGMASSGNHTEGTQWFVTHSPTPHLDGRYTLFAEVIDDGMETVNKITLGDKIQQIHIVK